jgi:hypothetical protein
MRATHHIKLQRLIPSSISSKAVLDYLHDHERMLSAQPNVSSYIEQSRPTQPSNLAQDDNEAKVELDDGTEGFLDLEHARIYEIKEDVPLLGAIYFKSSFQDEPDGVKSVVQAPMGLIMKAAWQVIEPKADVGKADSGVILTENCEIGVNALVMPFVEWQFKKAHETMLDKILSDLE